MIRKAVITTAGEGTRMLPVTKEQPKEMLPLFAKNKNENVCLKPLLQIVFEQLYSVGIADFCFITGRGKRSIEEHFTQDYQYLESLRGRDKNVLTEELERFYKMYDSPRRKPDIRKAKKLLNWEQKVELEEGISKMIKWFEEKKS